MSTLIAKHHNGDLPDVHIKFRVVFVSLADFLTAHGHNSGQAGGKPLARGSKHYVLILARLPSTFIP
jgi:hypothetical protein